ncbi:MAG: general secretion pathway protein GspK [Candidatus Binatia bacterium]
MKKLSVLSPQHSALANQRGVALVIVLWIFIFLFVVAFDFSASVREEGMATHRYAQEAEGYYLALAGFQQGVYELLKLSAQTGQVVLQQGDDLFEGNWKKGTLGQGVYEVRFVDEAGKINLNRANDDTLRRIFMHLGVDERQRNTIVDSIMDWRDEDDLHRLNGAESDYYLTLSPPYTARNGAFDTVEDLLWVKGMTAELFYGREGGVGLKEIFTLDSPAGVNLRTMTAPVCVALLGIPLEKCRAFIEQRAKLSEKTLADLLRLLGIADDSLIRRQVMFANPTIISIEAKGHQADSPTERQVRGVVRILGGDRGFELLRWLDRDSVRVQRVGGLIGEEEGRSGRL